MVTAGPVAAPLGQAIRRKRLSATRLRKVLASACIVAGAITVQSTFASESARRQSPAPLPMPGSIAGKVVHIADGDTLTLLDEHQVQRIIRLSDIDAPESGHGRSRPGQPYASVATSHLSALTFGKDARARCYDIDTRTASDGTSRDRYICHLTVNDLDVGMAMVDAGLAMVYRVNKSYVRNPAIYAHEDQARAARRGLWQDKSPTPPWQWRKACWKQAQCAIDGS